MSERKISYENYVRQELQKQAFKDSEMIWKTWENNIWGGWYEESYARRIR